MKQTAVEFLKGKLKNVEYNPLEKNGYSIAEERLFSQAEEMFKQHIINTWIDASSIRNRSEVGLLPFIKEAEQYYNETFNK